MTTQKAHTDVQQMQIIGNQALIINVLFFVVLFFGILLVPIAGFLPAVTVVGIAFLASILYLNNKKKKNPHIKL